ncbi:hypothetical protein AB1484_38480, partial [Parafrankia sp. FMc6]
MAGGRAARLPRLAARRRLDEPHPHRALEHHGPYAYYANPSSQYWISELARRLNAVRPGENTDYLTH